MNTAEHNILAISAGSSSIKFAIFAAGSSFYIKSKGQIERIGTLYCLFSVQGNDLSERFTKPVVAQDNMAAMNVLLDWIEENEKNMASLRWGIALFTVV